MRLVYKMYPDKHHSLVRTDDRGENPQVIGGEDPPRRGERHLAAYIEVSCDNDRSVIDTVCSALDEMKTNLAK